MVQVFFFYARTAFKSDVCAKQHQTVEETDSGFKIDAAATVFLAMWCDLSIFYG